MSNSTHAKKTAINNPMTDRWSLAARIFHWGGVLLLIVTWTMIVLHENSDGNTYIGLHKSFGFSVLCWTICRLINRVFTHAPVALPMSLWQKWLAHLTHFALYALLLAMPISGILMSWYGGRVVAVFDLFQLPSLVLPNRTQARFFNNLHTDIIWPAILLFSALHIIAALYHQFIIKDGVLMRMK